MPEAVRLTRWRGHRPRHQPGPRAVLVTCGHECSEGVVSWGVEDERRDPVEQVGSPKELAGPHGAGET